MCVLILLDMCPHPLYAGSHSHSKRGACTSAYVSIREHMSAYVGIRQHTSAYVSIREHTLRIRRAHDAPALRRVRPTLSSSFL
jgi:hypothetical protein